MKGRASMSPPLVGGITLLTVFAVLCLAVMSMLSLSAVRSDAELSRRSAEAVTAWYAADTRAEEILAELRRGGMPAGVTRRGDIYCYCVPIFGSRELQVEVRLEEGEYTVLRWQSAGAGDWEANEELAVWNGR